MKPHKEIIKEVFLNHHGKQCLPEMMMKEALTLRDKEFLEEFDNILKNCDVYTAYKRLEKLKSEVKK